MTDSEALTEDRVRRILAEIDEIAPDNDGPGAVSAFYTSLSFTEVRALCTLALSALGTAPAVGVLEASENTHLERILTVRSPHGFEYLINADKLAEAFGLFLGELDNEHRFGWELKSPWYADEIAKLRRAATSDQTALVASPAPAAAAEIRAGEHHKLDNDRQVFFYEQDFYVLSNFSAFSIRIWGGTRFDTSEAAYHWKKFDLDIPASREVQNNIYHSRSAHDAFKIAEENKRYRRPDWDDVKVDVMREIIRKKAEQHEYVRRKLLATGDRELIEDSWRDDFWGWGPNRDGQNMLGKLWMEVRSDLRALSEGSANGK